MLFLRELNRSVIQSIVKDNENNIIGGAIVYAHTSSVYVDVLWVSEKYRGMGIGAGVLRGVEAEAIKRGIPASTLDTFSFQAKGFYLKRRLSKFRDN
ncbi:Acetyltransferase (GNAT) family [Legionella pneumophila]|nr:GNAT family N-acetyltransferase [Legionella pneumophila]CZH01236.1 Acetyltransferase (GNAT) family [Legionella pneumophila]